MVDSPSRGRSIEELIADARRLLANLEGLRVTTMTPTDEELVTLTEAAERLASDTEERIRLRDRFEKWVSRDQLDVADRRPGPHRGIVLVRLSDVRALLADPPKRTGRPRKNGTA